MLCGEWGEGGRGRRKGEEGRETPRKRQEMKSKETEGDSDWGGGLGDMKERRDLFFVVVVILIVVREEAAVRI